MYIYIYICIDRYMFIGLSICFFLYICIKLLQSRSHQAKLLRIYLRLLEISGSSLVSMISCQRRQNQIGNESNLKSLLQLGAIWNWLVVWNMFPYIGNSHSHPYWLIFSRGWTHQPGNVVAGKTPLDDVLCYLCICAPCDTLHQLDFL